MFNIKTVISHLPDPRTKDGIKTIVKFIVARATSITIVAIVEQNVDTEDLHAHERAGVWIGAHVLGEMVADATEPFVERQIDELADMLTSSDEEPEPETDDLIAIETTS